MPIFTEGKKTESSGLYVYQLIVAASVGDVGLGA
jgi:hypothetical protein